MTLIVSTERLGWPGKESSLLERSGILQKRSQYPNSPNEPTATCHLQPSDRAIALCGYPWECLCPVPGATSFDDVPEEFRCDECASSQRAQPSASGSS